MGNRITTEELQLRVLIDGSPARKALAELDAEAAKLSTDLKDMGANTKAAKLALDSLDNVDIGKGNLKKSIAEVDAELVKLKARRDAIGKEINAATATGDQTQIDSVTAKHVAEWEQLGAAIADAETNQRKYGVDLKRLEGTEARIVGDLKAHGINAREAHAAHKRLTEITPEQARLRKEIGDTALTIRQLNDEMRRLQIQQRNTTRDTPQWVEQQIRITQLKKLIKDQTNDLAINERAWEKLRKELKLVDLSMEQLELEHRRLRAAQATLNPNAQAREFQNYARAITEVEKRQAFLRTGMGPFGKLWNDIKVNVASAGAVLTGMLAGTAIFTGIGNLVTGSAKLSDELANVRKVTNLTEAEVKKLNAEFGRIDTRTANTDLRAIAVGLGQIGQEASKINVEAIDKIVVALQDEFGTDPLQITNALSVLRNNLSDIKSGDYGKDVLHIGNALNKLGAEGLATAPVLTDIATRVSGVARTFNVSSGAIFGLAATFQELGINTERGSTAYIKTIQRMAAAPAGFAEVVRAAGFDVKQFALDLNNDMQAAFVTFARAAQLAGNSNTAFAKILKDLDADGAGISELVSKLGQNYGILEEKTVLATNALQEQSSILREFDLKNDNLAGTLAKLSKEVNRLFVNDTMVQWASNAVNAVRALVGWISRNGETLATLAGIVGRVALAWVTYRVTIAAVNGLSSIGARLTAIWGTAMGVLTGKVAAATAAQRVWNTVTRLHPIGFIVSALTTAITLFSDFGDEVEEAAEKQRQLNEELQEHIRQQRELAGVENRIFQTRADPRGASVENLRESIQKVGEELDGLSEKAFNAEEALRNSLFKAPTLERSDAPEGAAANDYGLFLDTDLLNAESERGQRNIKKVYDAYKAFLENEKKELERVAAGKAKNAGADLTDDKAKAERERAVSELERMREQMLDVREKLYQDTLTAGARDLREIDVRYAKLRAAVLANEAHTAEDLKALDAVYAAERTALRLRLEQENQAAIYEAKEQVYALEQNEEEAAILALQQKLDQEVALYEKAGKETAALVLKYEKLMDDTRDQYRTERLNSEIKALQQEQAVRINTYNAIGSATAGLNQFLSAVYSDSQNRAFKDTAFGKALALVQIGTSAAVAVAKATEKSVEGDPYTLAARIALAVGAVLGAIGSAYALLRAAPPTPPPPGSDSGMEAPVLQEVPLGESGAFTQGNRITTPSGKDEAGILEGPSHADDGLDVINPKTGKKVAEFEGGEAYMLFSKRFTDNNRDNLNRLLEASRTGARLNFITSPTRNIAPVVQRVLSQGYYAGGGIVGSGGYTFTKGRGGEADGGGYGFEIPSKKQLNPGEADGGGGMDATNALLLKLIGKMDEQTAIVQQDALNPRPAELVLNRSYDRALAERERVKDLHRVKRTSS